jgi:hypothetical protein
MMKKSSSDLIPHSITPADDLGKYWAAVALAPIQLPPNPKNKEEALQEGPYKEKWMAALRKELSNFDDRHTLGNPKYDCDRAHKTKLIL